MTKLTQAMPRVRSAPALALSFICVLAACGDDDAAVDMGSTSDAGVDGSMSTDLGTDASGDAALTDAALTDAGDEDAAMSDAGAPAILADVVADLCGAVARIRCSVPWDCACPRFPSRPDEATCITRETSDCTVTFSESPRGTGIAAGTLRADRTLLTTCLANIEASYARCSGSVADIDERCGAAFQSAVALGAECFLGTCAGGSGVCIGGLCTELPVAGDDCVSNLCASGLRCVSGLCATPVAAGAACENDADCAGTLACNRGRCNVVGDVAASCTSAAQCARGLACASGGCASAPTAECTGTDASICAGLERCGEPQFESRCRATAALGEACDDITGCTMGVCDFSGTPPTCAPLRTVGGTCSDASECATGLLCSIEGACRVPATSGAPCMSTGCATGLACVSDSCRPAPTAGQPCSDVGTCAAGLGCLVGSGAPVCGAPRAIGDACLGGTLECGTNGSCEGSLCVLRRATGGSCFGDDQCVAGLKCLFDPVAGDSICQPPRPLGAVCAGSCITGTYCRNETLPSVCQAAVCDQLFLIASEEP